MSELPEEVLIQTVTMDNDSAFDSQLPFEDSVQKFGIDNNQQGNYDLEKWKCSAEPVDTIKTISSPCSSSSVIIGSASYSQFLQNSIQPNVTSQPKYGECSSPVSTPEIISDSERSSLNTPHKYGSAVGSSLTDIPATSVSPPLISDTPDISPQRAAAQNQNTQEWVTFGEKIHIAKDQLLLHSLPSTSFVKPPDIPTRRAYHHSTASSLSEDVDLLSMDNDALTEHLYRNSPVTISEQIPPVPDRVLSPHKDSSCNSQTSSGGTKIFDIRLPPPSAGSGGHKPRPRIRGSVKTCTSPSSIVPPIPPRKDIFSPTKAGKNLPVARQLDLHESQWVKFEETTTTVSTKVNTKESYIEEPIAFASCESDQNSIQSSSSFQMLREILAKPHDSNSVNTVGSTGENISAPDNDLWISSASPTESLKSAKKKKGGYQHLACESDEEEKVTSSQPDGTSVSILVTDMSPVKPMSNWAPIANEDVACSSENVSKCNSSLGDPMPDDLGLDDDCSLNGNRLSSDVNSLKGFNRADKGSQNNLVDFSESAEKLDASDCGNDDSSNEDLDEETIFDMTAQGDSLKRKRKKNGNYVAADSCATPSFRIGVDDCDNSSISDSAHETDPDPKTSIEAKPSASTNPFWSHSPLGDTASVASSTSESNPFEKVQFQSVITPTSSISCPPVKSSTAFPTIPPPPPSAKSRTSSSSSRRTRTREASTSSPFSDVRRERETSFSVQTSTPGLETSCKVVNYSLPTPSKCDPSTQTMTSHLKRDSGSDGAGVDVPDGVAANTAADIVSIASTSKQNPSILETTLSILDVFSKPAEDDPPLNIDSTDIKTYHSFQATVSQPDLRDESLDSLEKLHKAVSVETPEGPADVKKIALIRDDFLIPDVTEWKMLMRFPREKRVMSSRKWVSIYVRLDKKKAHRPTLQLYHSSETQDPFFFIPLAEHHWQITEPVIQPRFYNTTSLQETEMEAAKRKVHTVKIINVHYKEKRAFMSKRDQLLLRMPSGFKHSMKGKQVAKLGTETYSDLISMLVAVHDAAFAANTLPDRSKEQTETEEARQPVMNFHSRDEIVFDVHDDFRGFVSSAGKIEACQVAVHVFVTSFLSGDPLVTVTFNDKQVQGCEVAKREDIMPTSNDNWIELRDIAFHKCSASRGYDAQTASVIFRPPDARRFEWMRFSTPYAETELPVAVKAFIIVQGAQVTLRCVLRSGTNHSSNKDQLTQVPCEDLSIRFNLPDSWLPAFRRSGRFRIKSVHAKRIVNKAPTARSAACTNAVLEASVGSAKYEVAHRAVVWRIGRFPEKNAVQNVPQVLSCKLELSSDRDLPDISERTFQACEVEYNMPSATASNSCIRSVHLSNNGNNAEKFTCYSAHFFYKVGIAVEHERDEVNSDRPSCTTQ